MLIRWKLLFALPRLLCKANNCLLQLVIYKYKDHNALNTVGYKELFDYLDGKCTLEEAISDIKTDTRRYAKRQMTWFKRDGQYEEIILS